MTEATCLHDLLGRGLSAQDSNAPPPISSRRRWSPMTARKSWDEICSSPQYRGRWVALNDCSYDAETGKAREGDIIDADDCLAELCARVRDGRVG